MSNLERGLFFLGGGEVIQKNDHLKGGGTCEKNWLAEEGSCDS